MSLVDDRGRLFGAINLIDLAVGVFMAVLVPLAYGAYILLRTPPTTLTGVSPASVSFVAGVEQRVQVTGEHLRPFLRAKLSTFDARAFIVDTPQSAELRFVDLPPGVYDVVLNDEAQEVVRLRQALTVLPPPVRIVGSFVGWAPKGDARTVALTGVATGTDVELLELDPNETSAGRAATLRVVCGLSPDKACLLGGVVVKPGSKLPVTAPGAAETAAFLVSEVRIDRPWVGVKVRLMGLPESLALVHPGDVDRGTDDVNANSSRTPGVTSRAIVRHVGDVMKSQGTYAITTSQPQTVTPDLKTYGVLSAALPVDARLADLTLPIDPSDAGPRYRDALVRPGTVMPFETATYRVHALIVSVSKPDHDPRQVAHP